MKSAEVVRRKRESSTSCLTSGFFLCLQKPSRILALIPSWIFSSKISVSSCFFIWNFPKRFRVKFLCKDFKISISHITGRIRAMTLEYKHVNSSCIKGTVAWYFLAFFHESTTHRPLMNVKEMLYSFFANSLRYSCTKFELPRVIRGK